MRADKKFGGKTDLQRYDEIHTRARQIYKARDKVHQGTWKEAGWNDTLNHVESKTRRVLKSRRHRLDDLTDEQIEKLIDDSLDLINYVTFLIDNVECRREYDDFASF